MKGCNIGELDHEIISIQEIKMNEVKKDIVLESSYISIEGVSEGELISFTTPILYVIVGRYRMFLPTAWNYHRKMDTFSQLN